MPPPPLTRSIGSAERAMRALLEQMLQGAHLSFAEWTVLAFTNTSPLSSAQIVQRQISGHVVADTAQAQESIDNLLAAGLITANQDKLLMHTNQGAAVFPPLSNEIETITRHLYGDLPIADLDATHRTLLEIATRAHHLLARSNCCL
ncbi:MAG: hypothetical protein HY080_10215 [Gammaproteobacteria bacterium]|nr:hypothetical protein [Gammaproteobacteria bacterium]